MTQWVKDSALLLLWLMSLLWHKFYPWPQEHQHAMGTTKKNLNRGEKIKKSIHLRSAETISVSFRAPSRARVCHVGDPLN